ncbi:MAG: tetratricopeptide repeat protein, partial [Aggregatilineales bacterium]
MNTGSQQIMVADKVSVLVRQAQEQMKRQDYRGAIGSFSMALEIDPENANIYHSRGLLHYMQKS